MVSHEIIFQIMSWDVLTWLTFFHTKKENKSYHIDFLFLKALNAQRVEIGSYSEWIRFSDHMPLICEVQ